MSVISNIFNGKIAMSEVDKKQSNLQSIKNFFRRAKVDTKKENNLSLKLAHGKGPKLLIPKQMLWKLQIVLAQVKAGTCTRKFTMWKRSNHTFFVSSKGNYWKRI